MTVFRAQYFKSSFYVKVHGEKFFNKECEDTKSHDGHKKLSFRHHVVVDSVVHVESDHHKVAKKQGTWDHAQLFQCCTQDLDDTLVDQLPVKLQTVVLIPLQPVFNPNTHVRMKRVDKEDQIAVEQSNCSVLDWPVFRRDQIDLPDCQKSDQCAWHDVCDALDQVFDQAQIVP